MNPHLHRTLNWLPHFSGLAAFATVIFCGLVVYDTIFVRGEDFITMEPGHAHGWNTENGLVVLYERAFTIAEEADGMDGEVQRLVRCPPDGSDQFYFDGPVLKRNFKAGYYPAVKRPMTFGAKVPVGTECTLEVWASWRPRFAVTSSRWLLDTMRFTVQENPPL